MPSFVFGNLLKLSFNLTLGSGVERRFRFGVNGERQSQGFMEVGGVVEQRFVAQIG